MAVADSRLYGGEQAIDPQSTRLDTVLLADWSHLAETIRRFSDTIELTWEDVLRAGAPAGRFMACAEVSNGLHRVLVTLTDSLDDNDLLDPRTAPE